MARVWVERYVRNGSPVAGHWRGVPEVVGIVASMVPGDSVTIGGSTISLTKDRRAGRFQIRGGKQQRISQTNDPRMAVDEAMVRPDPTRRRVKGTEEEELARGARNARMKDRLKATGDVDWTAIKAGDRIEVRGEVKTVRRITERTLKDGSTSVVAHFKEGGSWPIGSKRAGITQAGTVRRVGDDVPLSAPANDATRAKLQENLDFNLAKQDRDEYDDAYATVLQEAMRSGRDDLASWAREKRVLVEQAAEREPNSWRHGLISGYQAVERFVEQTATPPPVITGPGVGLGRRVPLSPEEKAERRRERRRRRRQQQ